MGLLSKYKHDAFHAQPGGHLSMAQHLARKPAELAGVDMFLFVPVWVTFINGKPVEAWDSVGDTVDLDRIDYGLARGGKQDG